MVGSFPVGFAVGGCPINKKKKGRPGSKKAFFFSGWVRNNKKSVFFLNIYFLKVAFVVNLGVV